jgi:DNA-binding MarR family transcriptional regulator
LLERQQLSMHHFAVLLAVGEGRGVPQQRVSALIGVDLRNVVPIVDELERRGILARRADAADRRRYNLALTKEGRRMLGELRTAGDELEEGMLKALSIDERQQLQRLLVKLFEALPSSERG